MKTKTIKTTSINTLVLIIFTAISILVAEVVLRILGYQPRQIVIYENEITTHEYHATLGWINKAGLYNFDPYTPGENEIQISNLEMGLRKTHEHQGNVRDSRPKIIFVGGSLTQGWAISDYETHPWKVQEYFPSFEVLNFGTGGYGTYQSLLTLEKVLPVLHEPIIVFYGFIGHHDIRNVAPADWLAALSSQSKRSHVFVPFATVDENNALLRHQPEAYITLPFNDELVIVSLVERALMNFKRQGRQDQKRLVTEIILLQMDTLVAMYGAKFVPVTLSAHKKKKSHYMEFLESNGITAIDCVYPLGESMIVKGEGHPNGELNSIWASCIKDAINTHSLATR